jgi:hypothetical protein
MRDEGHGGSAEKRAALRILGAKPDNDATPFFQEKRGELKPLVRN